MSESTFIDLVRFGWLTLTTMMLLSRVAFQLAGPVRMRAFLDRWQTSATKRVWGVVALAYAGALVALAATALDSPSVMDVALTVALVAVLVADGAVNVLPAGFETFKDRVQQRWVAARGAGERAGDAHLFAVGNLVLALAAGGVAALVVLYRSLDPLVAVAAVGTGTLLTGLLIAGATAERGGTPVAR